MTGDFAVAVHALVFLNHRGETLASDILAKNICTNPARVRKVMARLRRAGLVEAREGKFDGGYTSIKEAPSIRLSDVLDAIGERCVESTWRPVSEEMDCLVSSGMAGVMDAIYDQLNDSCRKKLEEITIEQVSNAIFARESKKA